ncbi:hypothetical protein [Paenibacillus humicus]|uniref:hypothetical protein n=1 Tax=Paenibacillus humicus TaxID=412861 RepID=UPI000FDB8413|nr:hypothetical protein [Paenibacillus humicus]
MKSFGFSRDEELLGVAKSMMNFDFKKITETFDARAKRFHEKPFHSSLRSLAEQLLLKLSCPCTSCLAARSVYAIRSHPAADGLADLMLDPQLVRHHRDELGVRFALMVRNSAFNGRKCPANTRF